MHSMGEGILSRVQQDAPLCPCASTPRWAEHRDLLAHLVRRLLENGANSSFVHQLSDPEVPVAQLLRRALAAARALACACRFSSLGATAVPARPGLDLAEPTARCCLADCAADGSDRRPSQATAVAIDRAMATLQSRRTRLGRTPCGPARRLPPPHGRTARRPAARLLRPSDARSRQRPRRTPSPRCAGGGLLPLLRRPGRAGGRADASQASSSASRLELPACHLCGPGGCCGAGDRQCRGRQARRANATPWRRAMVTLLLPRLACRPRRCSAARPRRTMWARRAGGAPACAGVCFTGSTAVAQHIIARWRLAHHAR